MNKSAKLFETTPNYRAIFKLAAFQALATLVVCCGVYVYFDTREALSALFGGLVATTMNLFMAGRLFGVSRILKIRSMHANEALIRFYISVVLKILFTLTMMVFFIVVIEVSILSFIVTYLIAAVIVNLCFLLLDS